MTFPILASLLVRLVVLLPFQLLRLSLATPSRWTPLALSVFLHYVVALLFTLLYSFLIRTSRLGPLMVRSPLSSGGMVPIARVPRVLTILLISPMQLFLARLSLLPVKAL